MAELKKDGTQKKNCCYNKQKGKKSEVLPFKVEDVKKLIKYFTENEMWLYYLLFILSCNLGRRVSDMLSLKWEDFFNPKNGNFRNDIEIKEKKTKKLISLLINQTCKDAINLYLQKTNCNVAAENYSTPVFIQLEGNFRGKLISDSAYLKVLKKAGEEVGIEYNIGTHSPRKTFGMITKMIHPADGFALPTLQYMFNHSSEQITLNYIGITKERVDGYLKDMSDFFTDYIIGEKEYKKDAKTPIVSLDTNDLRDIIKAAYEAGRNNAMENDAMIHINAITEIMQMIEGLQK